LQWSDAQELIAHLGQVQPTEGGEFAFVLGTHREFFRRPSSSELGIEEVSRLRRLLKAASTDAPALVLQGACRMIVVIDHHAAHICRVAGDGAPQAEVTIKPYDPYNFHHHLIHRKEAHYQGGRVPEETSFYQEVAAALAPAKEIVLIGHGTGTSSAVSALAAHLEKHCPEVSRRVIAIETADLSALSQPELLAMVQRRMDRLVAG
jgi:hypothetical protein